MHHLIIAQQAWSTSIQPTVSLSQCPREDYPYTQGANHPIFVKTDMVCYKRLLPMVGFIGPPATTSRWTTFPTGTILHDM